LNDAAFVELAQGLARRVVDEAPADPVERVRHGFRLCVAREPRTDERQRLVDFLGQVRADFEAHPVEAVAWPGRSDLPPSEMAAWTTVARVLLNLDEFITRE